ncbi:MAG: spore germination protein [Gloeocapsa sp. DLM2.Bin57]|nr:MAG: spore germination protein [Gloeocapsa sp. DLM2.Bin57]
MGHTKKKNSSSLGVIIGVSTALIAIGGVASWWAFKSMEVKVVEPIDKPPHTVVEPSQTTKTVEVYWLDSNANDLELVATPITFEVEESATSEQILTTGLEMLLAGPGTGNYTTTIPQTTQLLNLSIKEDGIHLNLSKDFTTGGGSADMIARLGQIIYTSTTLDPHAGVWIEVEGQPLELLGGEGLMIGQPMTRQDFEENFALEATN